MAEPIDFYFDFASPYGYLGSLQIDAVAERHGREVMWRPIMLGAMFKAVGTAPLGQYPIKGDYSARDIAREARRLGVPLAHPPGFPHGTLAAARGFYWLMKSDPAKAKELANAFYAVYFGEGRDVSGAEDTADIAAAIGIDRDEYLAAIQDPAIKDQLKAETNTALERGVFGSPFFFVDGEPFWGSDHLMQVERWLETGGW
jgi:2-hydroxychromene-2-carboxylate isomerase